MILRAHQAQVDSICDEILAGAPVKQIIAAVTPGGGKSKLPVILAEKLIPRFADRILWIAPRNNLKTQGEAEFLDPRFPSSKRMRAADGNEADPCRGADGYITTYQAVGLSPESHVAFCRKFRTILFLDESHHVADGEKWAEAVEQLRAAAVLVVDASGTLARGDGQKISGIEYAGLHVDLSDREHVRVVRYTREQALKDGAILPIRFRHIDGRAEWEDEQGEVRSVGSLSGTDYAAPALFTALRTGYAHELLDETLTHWRTYRASTYPQGKLLVVAPDIKTAQDYFEHLGRRGLEALVATSDDGPRAREAIDRFKGQALPSCDILVTCQMAYEGMSVPAISHIACLTHIRSIPWLEQCFARGNRVAPGKREAFVFAPMDDRIRAAIRSIEAEQSQALRDAGEGQGEAGGEQGEGEGQGGGRPGIRPIGSAAYREGSELFDAPAPRPDGGLTPSQAEKLLRSQIADHIDTVLGRKRPGSKAAYSRIVHSRLRELVGGKAREECSVDELSAQLAWLKREMPL